MCDNDRSHVIAMECEAAGNARDASFHALQREERMNRPSYIYRPSLSPDGNKWCALLGDDLQCGVCGFGDSPEEAYRDFDRAWQEKWTEKEVATSPFIEAAKVLGPGALMESHEPGVYFRAECTFRYCPTPEECRDSKKCFSPKDEIEKAQDGKP